MTSIRRAVLLAIALTPALAAAELPASTRAEVSTPQVGALRLAARNVQARARLALMRHQIRAAHFAPAVERRALQRLEEIQRDGDRFGTYSTPKNLGARRIEAVGVERNGVSVADAEIGAWDRFKVRELRVYSSKPDAPRSGKTQRSYLALTPNVTLVGDWDKGKSFLIEHRGGKTTRVVTLRHDVGKDALFRWQVGDLKKQLEQGGLALEQAATKAGLR